jgi:hypothetical protein
VQGFVQLWLSQSETLAQNSAASAPVMTAEMLSLALEPPGTVIVKLVVAFPPTISWFPKSYESGWSVTA